MCTVLPLVPLSPRYSSVIRVFFSSRALNYAYLNVCMHASDLFLPNLVASLKNLLFILTELLLLFLYTRPAAACSPLALTLRHSLHNLLAFISRGKGICQHLSDYPRRFLFLCSWLARAVPPIFNFVAARCKRLRRHWRLLAAKLLFSGRFYWLPSASFWRLVRTVPVVLLQQMAADIIRELKFN